MPNDDELLFMAEQALRIIDEFRASDLETVHIKQGELEVTLSRRADGQRVVPVLSRDSPDSEPSPAHRSPAASGRVSDGTRTGDDVNPAADVASAASAGANGDRLVVVRAPMVGTVYLAPRAGDQPFVTVGQTVSETQTVVLIEAMKLFTAVPAGHIGTITEIFIENGSFVDHGQELVGIRMEAPA